MHSASPQCGRRSRLITYRIAPKNIYSDWLPPPPLPYFFFKLLFRSECLSDAKTATRGRFLRCSVTIKGSQSGVTARVASGRSSELSPPESRWVTFKQRIALARMFSGTQSRITAASITQWWVSRRACLGVVMVPRRDD